MLHTSTYLIVGYWFFEYSTSHDWNCETISVTVVAADPPLRLAMPQFGIENYAALDRDATVWSYAISLAGCNGELAIYIYIQGVSSLRSLTPCACAALPRL